MNEPFIETDFFETIRELFDNELFCDLKIVTASDENSSHGASNRPIFCHSLVLCSVLPELTSYLASSHAPMEEQKTLILEGYNRDSLQHTINEIYAELVDYSGRQLKQPLLDTFGLLLGAQNSYEQNQASLEISRAEYYTKDPVSLEITCSANSKFCDDFYNGGEEGYQEPENAVLNIEDRSPLDETYLQDDKTEITTKRITISKDNRNPKRQLPGKLKNSSAKSIKLESNVINTEKVCFGCLRHYPYSTRKERKIYLKHTLEHCKCECGVSFKSKIDFENHMKSVHHGHLYKCDFKDCNAKSSLLKEYIRHRQKHVLCRKEESNVCPDCGREFVNSYYMKAHYGSRHKKMKCKLCGVYTYGTDDNQKHHNAEHKPNLVCEFCGKNFKTKSTLRCHVINVHTPEDQRPYKCDFCPKGFLNSRYLLTHVERDHKGNRAFKCRALDCDRTFTLPEVRKRHEKRDHNLNINLKPGLTSKFEILNDPRSDISPARSYESQSANSSHVD